MTINLLENERLDDLQRKGYKIIQNTNIFCFGIDAVLLSAFASLREHENAIDLGTGNGIIPLLLSARYGGKHITGLEIQDINVNMAARSVALNNLTEKIDIVKGDICKASEIFGCNTFNVVTSNPPYMNENHGITNPESAKAIARHELLCTLEDVIREGARLLKVKGRMYMVHRPHRVVEIFNRMAQYKLEPKRVRFVHPFADKEANMVLIEAVKGGNPGIKVEKPLIVYEDVNVYTKEIMELYYGD